MAENSNSTLEMGTSDQVLVQAKKSKSLAYIIGGIAMLAAIGVVITLVVVLSGNEGSAAEPTTVVPGTTEALTTGPWSTEGPTTGLPPSESPATTTPATTTQVTTTPAPTTLPPQPEQPIDLADIIEGVFSAASFNGSWSSGNQVLFRNEYGNLILYDVDTDTPTLLVANTSQILQQSSRVTQLSADGTEVVLAYNIEPEYRHSFAARYATINIVSGDTTDILPPGVNATEEYLQNFVWGPTGTALAFVYKNNIYYKPSLTSEPVAITTTGEEYVVYHGIPDWVYEEEVFGTNNALWFSPDGHCMAYASFDDRNVRIMKVPHYGVPGSVFYQYTRHNEIRYPKPGTTNPTASVTLFDLDTSINTTYHGPSQLEQPILRVVRFVDNTTVALLWTNRVQTSLIVELCTLGQSDCVQIYEYTESNGWVDNIPLFFNQQGNSFITILPRAVNGVLYKQIVQVSAPATAGNLWTAADRTNVAHTVLEILDWTSDDIVWYKATHVDDSAQQHVYTVGASGAVACFTCDIQREDGGECLYNDAIVSTGADKVTVNCAGPSVPQVFIYNSSGSLLKTWDENAETVAALSNRNVPPTIRMSVPVADGLPDADVQIQVPADYQSRTDIPLLVYVYGGPDSALVTKQWGVDWGTSLVNRWGIAVAHIDGRGSGLRGVANTFTLNRALGSVEVEDQINVTRYLQDNLPWVDGNRTCIWGWSYGGYVSSFALARGGPVFRCAIAVAPVVDWRFYDTIYTERYMDVPENNTQAYSDSSLLTEEVVEAYRSKRYFLIHGTADDNVHYQHAMLLSRMLQRRDVYFTQMSYTDEDHGLVGVRPHLYHSLEKFLSENLL